MVVSLDKAFPQLIRSHVDVTLDRVTHAMLIPIAGDPASLLFDDMLSLDSNGYWGRQETIGRG